MRALLWRLVRWHGKNEGDLMHPHCPICFAWHSYELYLGLGG